MVFKNVTGVSRFPKAVRIAKQASLVAIFRWLDRQIDCGVARVATRRFDVDIDTSKAARAQAARTPAELPSKRDVRDHVHPLAAVRALDRGVLGHQEDLRVDVVIGAVARAVGDNLVDDLRTTLHRVFMHSFPTLILHRFGLLVLARYPAACDGRLGNLADGLRARIGRCKHVVHRAAFLRVGDDLWFGL